MAGGNAIRGTRVGAGPMGEAERGDTAPRLYVSYFCASGHVTRPAFAADAQIPDSWDCPRCGLPANTDEENPPPPPKITPYKTHILEPDHDIENLSDEEVDRTGAMYNNLEGLYCYNGRFQGVFSRLGPLPTISKPMRGITAATIWVDE